MPALAPIHMCQCEFGAGHQAAKVDRQLAVNGEVGFVDEGADVVDARRC